MVDAFGREVGPCGASFLLLAMETGGEGEFVGRICFHFCSLNYG
jgi:hypothetical protein